MASGPRHHRYTFADYVLLEQDSNVRHEFLDGEIYAMAGGTPDHARLAMNVGAALLSRLGDGPCQVFSSDLRVRSLATGLATYPDVTVVCGPLQRDPQSRDTVVNPRVVVEVLSDSTEEYDRGEKLDHYRTIPSLEAVLLVSHRGQRVTLWSRVADSWQSRELDAGDVELGALGLRIPLSDIYRGGLSDAG